MREKHLRDIEDTKKQICLAKSGKRKYELTRHLRKLQKEYKLYCILRGEH